MGQGCRSKWIYFARCKHGISTHLFIHVLAQSWKGKYSTSDPASWKNSVLAAEIGYNVELAAKHDDGVFWICWDDVLKYFQNIQLSWNPNLFPSRSTIHDFWPVTLGPQVCCSSACCCCCYCCCSWYDVPFTMFAGWHIQYRRESTVCTTFVEGCY